MKTWLNMLNISTTKIASSHVEEVYLLHAYNDDDEPVNVDEGHDSVGP